MSTRKSPTNGQASDTGSDSIGGRASSVTSQPQDYKKSIANEHKAQFSNVTGVTSRDDTLFEVPSSDDEHTARVHAIARKRRKIVSRSVDDGDSLVFDDASLQRHVAAEVSKEMDSLLDPSKKNTPGKSVRCAHARSESQSNKRLSPSVKQHRVPRAQEFHGQADPARAAVVPSAQSNKEVTSHQGSKNEARLLKTEAPRPKTQRIKNGHSKDIVRPVTLENTPRTTLVHRSSVSHQRLASSAKAPYPPSTPPRPIKTPDAATTPRQRELWNKLLSEDTHTESPSHIDLPGLILSDNNAGRSEGRPTARKVTWGKARDHDIKTRPDRIIDNLHSSDHSLLQLDHDEMDASSQGSSSHAGSRYQQSDGSAVDVVTVQTSPSADSQHRGQVLNPQPSQPSQTASSLHGVGPKVTYARQRSYLTDYDLEEAAMLEVPETTNRKGASRRALGGNAASLQSTNVFENEDIGAGQDSQGGAMRSIHELREAGGNVRLASEFDAILDDLDEKELVSISLRRMRLIDLVTKLQEPSQCRLFVDQAMESRLLLHVGSGNDAIADSLLVAAILQLMVGSISTPLLAQVSDVRVVEFLIGLLGLDQDLTTAANLRSTNMSKVTQQEYRGLCTSLLNSSSWRAGKPPLLTCHLLALQCLEYLVRQTREAGSLSEVLSAHAIRRIVATSLPSSLKPLPAPDAISTINLELAVSVLESCTISNAAECQESLWAGETLERVVGLLPLLASWTEEKCATSRTLTLRLYVNLTNNNPGLCEDFSTPAIVDALSRIIILKFKQLSDHAGKEEKPLVLDHLILALGSFSNLAESSDLARQPVMDLHYGTHSYLDVLLELFMMKSKSSAEVSSRLLILLTNDTDSYRRIVRRKPART